MNSSSESFGSNLSTSSPDAYGTVWRDLKIGAGGYVRGIDIAADGTKVIRTDTYGAYIWNGTMWQQLVTANSMPASAAQLGNAAGVYEIRIASNNTQRLYMFYNGEIYRSDNRGTAWIATAFSPTTPEPSATANDSYGGDGEKMAVDPANDNVVYAGTEASGLWVTTNAGASWSPVSSVPAGTNSGGFAGIAFDPSSGTEGGKTKTIYVGSMGNGVYVSIDAGATWTKTNGGPTTVQNAVVASDGIYYAVDGSKAWKYASGNWTSLYGPDGNGVHSIAIDPANVNRIVLGSYGGGLNQSTDQGATWSGIYWGSSTNPVSRIATDIPWLAWTNENYMTNGNMIFDPTQSNKLYFSEGIGVWYTSLSPTQTWNDGPTWTSQSAGIEQLVANEVISPPRGKPLVASWDRPVFVINDPDVYPSTHGPNNTNAIIAGWSIDWASSDPSFITAIMEGQGHEESGFSTDGGQTWTTFASTPSSVTGGSIAAASPADIIWAPSNSSQPYLTQDGGKTWHQINMPGSPQASGWGSAYYLDRQIVAADRVSIGTFYAYNVNSGVFRSNDGGTTWALVHSGELIPFDYYNSELAAVPNEAGNLFYCAGNASGQTLTNPGSQPFIRSTDGGATWSNVPNVMGVYTFGFGAPLVSGGYPSIYIVGWVKGAYGIWRSTDNAATWKQVGLWPMGSLDLIKTISGDMNVYGRVYVGFGGSGYMYGDTQ